MTENPDPITTLVRTLALEPHPEGGWFRQVYRSTSKIQPLDGRIPRSALTAIYYLLRSGEISRWHRVRSDEIWYLLEGEPLDIFIAPADFSSVTRHRLDRVIAGAQPWFVVPAGCWQAARPAGGFALTSCVVGPGFEYADFTLLADDPVGLAAASALAHEHRLLI